MPQVESGERTSPATASNSGEILRAQLAIEPHPDSNCAVVECGTDVESLTQDLKRSSACVDERGDGGCGGEGCRECHAEVTLDGPVEKQRQYLKSSVQPNCICPVFEEHDCVPDIKSVRSGAVITVVTVRERAVLKGLCLITRRRRIRSTE